MRFEASAGSSSRVLGFRGERWSKGMKRWLGFQQEDTWDLGETVGEDCGAEGETFECRT